MVTNKKKSLVDVFAGSPWEVNSVIELLTASYIKVSIKDKDLNSIRLSVPYDQYNAAIQLIDGKKIF
ncbi:MAG: hypothetical protein KA476_01135 [Bacteroides sp.]|jgi:transcription antitermination factor NusA-like protein|nr:hypothetical protein [Bacteroides sp.]MBP6069401.1 hypothetical protein [Bacteroides sp.]MBP7292995.1 hypothetical protein [Bacteroides sp.]MBP9719979.1 hypothetical protein [Bacteroides sp.]